MTGAEGRQPLDRDQLKRTAERLRAAGLRPTRQRMRILALLARGGDRHLTAADVLEEAQQAGLEVSFATIYNTLKTFTEHGLLKILPLGAGRILFDTNTRPHFHLHVEETGELIELPPDLESIAEISSRLSGEERQRLEVLAYVRRRSGAKQER